MYQDEKQPLIDINTVFEIEHIYAKKRGEIEDLARSKIEALDNKALHEKRINIRASDYRLRGREEILSRL